MSKPSELVYGGEKFTAPIPFRRESNGVYVSKCGLFRIHKTEHTGYGASSHTQGRVRWHVTHVPTGRDMLFRFNGRGGGYTLSLEDAITDLHGNLARDICDGFAVLANWRKQQLDEQRRRDESERAVVALTAKIDAWLTCHAPTEVYLKLDARGLAEYLSSQGVKQ